MYSLNIEPQHTSQPVIKRRLSTNHAIELLPVVVEMCRSQFNMIEPVAISMGGDVFRVFDIYNPDVYVNVHFIEDAN